MKTRARTDGARSLPGKVAAARFQVERTVGHSRGGRWLGTGQVWHRARLAFTLLEVMIAAAIYFIAMFAVLRLLSTEMNAAFLLQRNYPTPVMAVAKLSLTNKLEEVPVSEDFGEVYPDYKYYLEPHEIMTNGLFQVDVTVFHKDKVFSTMSVLLYRPESEKRF
jgi:hypothetical protein